MQKRLRHIAPAQIVLGSFMLLILAGALLLMLPISSQSRQLTPFIDALFTATSATCVTGLVVVDTATYWSVFGQAVIMLLIQIGGMGVVTMAVIVSLLSGRRIGFRQRYVMQESISAPQVGGIVRLTGFILRFTLTMELISAVLLAIRFIPEFGPLKGAWYGLFHSVSAFCNAGFDLMGVRAPFSSLVAYTGDWLVNLVIMVLIVSGGIGFFAWSDILHNKFHFHAYRLQTKLVLVTTGLLLVLPALYLFLYEFNQTAWQDLTLGERVWAALFQSVTPRTAGFNTVDLTLLHPVTIMMMIFLMLTGGSPGSTAGGFKTTSLAIVFLTVRAVYAKRDGVNTFGRRIPQDVLRSAVAIIVMYIMLFVAGSVAITLIEGLPLSMVLFECASAIGTVGLTLGCTTSLGPISQIILILLMYFGRVGGLTMIYALVSGHIPAPSQLPQERITIG